MTRPIIFLHLPKTGGQTIHHAIGRYVGEANIGPYRLQAQVQDGTPFPPEYRFHSGHLDWTELDTVAGDPFSFMVLRDPRERLGSFFFFMQEEARRALQAHGPDGIKPIHRELLKGADAVFFSDREDIKFLVHRHWANLTLTYLATRSLLRRPIWDRTPLAEMLTRAEENSRALSAIYRFGDFEQLEQDLIPLLNARPDIAAKRSNPGPLQQGISRWDRLLDRLDTDAHRHAMDQFVAEDIAVMERLTFR